MLSCRMQFFVATEKIENELDTDLSRTSEPILDAPVQKNSKTLNSYIYPSFLAIGQITYLLLYYRYILQKTVQLQSEPICIHKIMVNSTGHLTALCFVLLVFAVVDLPRRFCDEKFSTIGKETLALVFCLLVSLLFFVMVHFVFRLLTVRAEEASQANCERGCMHYQKHYKKVQEKLEPSSPE